MPPRRPDANKNHATVFISGAATLLFLLWLCWIVTHIVLSGIPEESRGELAGTALLAATGVAISAIVGARAANGDPLEFIASFASTIRGMVRRW